MSTARSVDAASGIATSRFIVIVTLANTALFHVPLCRYALANLDISSAHGIRTFVTLLAVVYVATALVLTVLAVLAPPLLKPVCMLFALTSAAALYFALTYSVIFDRAMMSNVLNTRSDESFELLHPMLLVYILVAGLLPAWAIVRVRLAPVRRLRLLAQGIAMLVSLLLFAWINSSTWLWFDDHAKRLGGLIMPWSYVSNLARAKAAQDDGLESLTLLPEGALSDDAPQLVILVIGETARAQNFSLYGYERDTNPRLAEAGVAVLQGATSCSTYTTASLHCMLSHDGSTSGSDEPLPSYLQRSGVDVIWRSANWGEPPLRVASYQKAGDLRAACKGEDCDFDNVLLSGLAERIEQSTSSKILVVLHTKGSHGPAYSTRYPARFDVFQPVCRTVELSRCSEQSLINAYDNTILATDDFLSRTIELLDERVRLPTLFLYVSDHGESLGEYGLYLHGTPNAIAPDVQRNIPFLVWMSDDFAGAKRTTVTDLERAPRHSHRQVFHSIVGAFGLQTPVYDPAFDIFEH